MDQEQGYSTAVRRHLTVFNSFDNYIFNKIVAGGHGTLRDRRMLQPHFNYFRNVTIPKGNRENPADGICTHFFLHGFNRAQKSPATAGAFSPDARRLIIGTDDGTFTLWEAETFKFERLITASTSAIRTMEFKNSGSVLIMGDNGGFVHYFNNSMKLVYSTNAHDSAPLRGLSCSPGDIKFASCGDNGAVKIWDWGRGMSELTLSEHSGEVRCVDWHPYRGLVASGGKDGTIKMWDPRQTGSLCTLYNHKNSVLCCEWNQNGNWLATGSRDYLVKIFDVRMMKETAVYKGHNKEVCSLAWHPVHEEVLVTGGFQGSLIYWMMGHEGPHSIIPNAHNYSVNVLKWHPVGHCLASAANDGILKIWGREPPGSSLENQISDYHEPLKVEYGPLPADHKSAIPEAVSTYNINQGDGNKGRQGPGGGGGHSRRDQGGGVAGGGGNGCGAAGGSSSASYYQPQSSVPTQPSASATTVPRDDGGDTGGRRVRTRFSK